VRPVQGEGEEPDLPDVATAAIGLVERQRVLGVGASEGASERILALQHRHKSSGSSPGFARRIARRAG